MLQDKISDLIIRLKNASAAGHFEVVLPYSKVNLAIAELLEKKGYLASSKKKGSEASARIEVTLPQKDDRGSKLIKDVKRISKPSKRIYRTKDEIFPVLGGYGMLVVSTSKGVMSGDEARKSKVGGEALFEIW